MNSWTKVDADHVGHETATSWFAANLKHGWASLSDHGKRHRAHRGKRRLYKPALAVRHHGRFVTFDQGIRATAVIGATAEHLVQLPA